VRVKNAIAGTTGLRVMKSEDEKLKLDVLRTDKALALLI
jgi:hypothetical protein